MDNKVVAYLDMVAGVMFENKKYKSTVEILELIRKYGQETAEHFEKLAECQYQQNNFVEAAMALDQASQRKPYPFASVSNESYYNLVEKLYTDLGVDFKIV